MEICLTAKKDFKGIDITKFLLAILVVAGHTHPFKDIKNPIFNQLWNSILLLVVPYFFMAAGFCLFSKVYQKTDKTYQLTTLWFYLKRIVRLYVYWTIIFLPITIWRYATDKLIFEKDIILFIRGTFFFGENYYSWPLWFLLSMIYAIAFIYFLTFINQQVSTIFLISIFVFITAMLFNYLVTGESENKYLLTVGKDVKYLFLTGRLFTGMFYLMVGGLISINKIRPSGAMLFFLVIVGTIFQFLKIEIISPLLFSLLPITLFYLTLNLKLEGLKNNLFLRKCSTVLYFTHMIVFFLYTLIFKEFTYFGWDAFLVSVIIPIMITPLVIRYEERLPILKSLFG
ncbi:acyltransferase family protein [Pedobacter sp. ASV28]|uniref:acyltransferase family protein n=1 Tax=Pedobacter sp. ASV28 TaxID=2795123 RepID=UPI0018ED57D1|nr:acyltransferase family protein [Pedobacter sp. ASV28]